MLEKYHDLLYMFCNINLQNLQYYQTNNNTIILEKEEKYRNTLIIHNVRVTT